MSLSYDPAAALVAIGIVRDLAAIDPFDEEWQQCVVCLGEYRTVKPPSWSSEYTYTKPVPNTHTPDCPYLRAQQWVEAH